ncbi:MAG: hypothetical protein SPI86_08440 [Treponemataceae bacterium]|nr:hypothetical protein [Spirochaetales bacterium]MDY6031771.1 hypothetical protein [Treponemataceae bacterium]
MTTKKKCHYNAFHYGIYSYTLRGFYEKIVFLAGLVICLTALVGCTTFQVNGLSWMPTNTEYVVCDHFKTRKTVHEFLGVSGGANLFNISSKVMNDKITKIITNEVQKAGADGAINISIEYKVGFWHTIANSFTGSIWAPARVIVEGDLVKRGRGTASIDTDAAIQAAVQSFMEENAEKISNNEING